MYSGKKQHRSIKQKTMVQALIVLTILLSNQTINNPVFISINNIMGVQEVQAAVTDNRDITILVNGNRISFEDADPFVEDGRTMVPLRGVFEAMGFSVNWDGDVWTGSGEDLQSIYGTTNPELIGINTSTNVVQGGDISVLKDNTIMQAGAKVETDKDPVLIGGRYYLPLRVIAENTGAVVGWNQDTKTVTIDFTAVPVVQDQAVVEDSLGVGYTGRWGDANTYDGKALEDQYGVLESINMDNYNHKIYFKDAAEGNGVVPTGAYYIQTDNALVGPDKHSISLGGVKLSNGESVYIGESQASVEGKFGKPDSTDADGTLVYNNNGGFRIRYTSSGRVKYIKVQSGTYNNFANQGFSYGSGSMYLGQEKGTETLSAGESMSNGSVRYQGLYFGTDTRIDYYWLESNGVWSSVVIEASNPNRDADPF